MRHGADTAMDDYEKNVFRPDEQVAQPSCFGLSYINGPPCNTCDLKKECSDKYFTRLVKSPIPDNYTSNTCEYQKRWETICRSQTSTDPKDSVKYVSYSCANCFCRYPERKCEVKK